MKFRSALVAATILALPLAANAQPVTGLYVGGAAGVNILQNENATVTSRVLDRSGQLQSRLGPAVAIDLGYGLGNGIRAEIEGSYRYNTFGGNTGTTIAAGGQEQKYGAMFNVLYDFVGFNSVVQPYVGIGGGYQWAQERNLHVGAPGLVATAPTNKDGKFAYQGIAGVAVPIATMPGLAVTASYRFMGLVGDRNYPGVVNGVPANLKLDKDYNHTILVGFRYNFGQAAPAPAVPAAAAVPPSPVSRSYLVFFDWDKANLTERARQIVSEAAANSTKVQYTQLEVNGYTDTSGTARYNQGLSVRRAQAVAAELVKDGVPRSAIEIQGFGETHLLVPTGNGVREPQNRRVEIIIR